MRETPRLAGVDPSANQHTMPADPAPVAAQIPACVCWSTARRSVVALHGPVSAPTVGSVSRIQLLCLVFGHRYQRRRYPDSPDGWFEHCLRCAHDRDDGGTDVRLGSGRGPR